MKELDKLEQACGNAYDHGFDKPCTCGQPVRARLAALERVAELSQHLLPYARTMMPSAQDLMDRLREALAELNRPSSSCAVCGKEGPTRIGNTCSRECEKGSNGLE